MKTRSPHLLAASLGVALLTLLPAISLADGPLQKYTDWTYEKEKNRYVCDYEYKHTPEAPTYEKQKVVYYPTPEKQQYYYYYNPTKQTYWGRCATPKHDTYKPEQMQWSYYKENNWTSLSDNCPSIPGLEGGPQIISPPDPPALP